MLHWLSENHQLLGSVASLGMLVVWAVYLHLFLDGYRRQHRVNILISKGPGSGMDSRCLIGNMSSQPIYVVGALVRLRGAGKSLTAAVTEVSGDGEELARRNLSQDIDEITRQGPLRTGRVYDIGSFNSIAEQALSSCFRTPGAMARAEATEIEVLIIAAFSSEDLLCGARRTFIISKPGKERHLRPSGVLATQIRSRRERRNLAAMLEQYTQA